ncbi:hypothetical protein QVD17_26933 [Tagetes erecta]|uniref:Protein kinase domain-containing protein n=1 Tax=Tagetes erecta TaxID=13708 RepID=A0AAD8NQK3_TARER|nr:hypothetical protein QVD17_26933 [Tagetes erecta]
MERALLPYKDLKIQLEEITSATNNFDNHNNYIGGGGFGNVYKGQVSHSKGRSLVAIKRLDPRHGQGIPEFLKEITTLSEHRHENLISLLGFCFQGDEMILVYELASRGSLDCHLNSPHLTWSQRIKICLDVAKGLSYLHDPRNTHQRLIHCDMKSSNILLDDQWNAKVSDFGLSIMGPANEKHSVIVTSAAGTCGYCDPQYAMTHTLTKESDMYSFGVVLFEVLCGRLCYITNTKGHVTQVLVPMWIESYKQKKLNDIIFKSPTTQPLDQNALETLSDIAYRCLKEYREDRPVMAEVVTELETALIQELSEGKLSHIFYKELTKSAEPPLNYTSKLELKKLLSKGVLFNSGKTVERKDGKQPVSDSYANWEDKLPTDYEEIINRSKNRIQWTTKKEAYSIIRKGFLVNNGKKRSIWFSLDKNGKKCHMLSATATVTCDSRKDTLMSYLPDSRFGEAVRFGFWCLEINNYVQSHLVSSQTTYAAYLVYKIRKEQSGSEAVIVVEDEEYLGSNNYWYIYLVSPQTPVIRSKIDRHTRNPLNGLKIKGIPQQRSDGWMEVQVWEFNTTTATKLIPMRLKLTTCGAKKFSGLIIEVKQGRSMVAIKRLDPRYGQGIPEFLKEITMLSRYRHDNLISLLGFCYQRNEMILVYELASHGSLDRHLNSPNLTWSQRIKICLDVAKGLSYLHDPRDTHQRLIHCDVKSANILLNDQWNAKVSDFGLSIIGPANEQHSVIITFAAGTPGYKLKGETETLLSYLAYEREDGWWMTELYQFTSDQRIVDLISGYAAIKAEGVEFSPLEKVEHKDENQPISDSDSDSNWEENLAADYEDIMKWSKDGVQWTTKNEAYSILRKGLLINHCKNGSIWFSLNKSGKKCHILSAKAAGIWTPNNDNLLVSLPESRFGEAFRMFLRENVMTIEIQPQLLSSQTTYACYLVYKLPKDQSGFEVPMLVKYRKWRHYIYFVAPQTPVIRPKAGQKTHNPLAE